MIAFALQHWRLLVCAAAGVVLFVAGWTVNGMRWDAKLSDIQASHARALAVANAEALQRTKEAAADVARIDATRLAELQEARREVEVLRADVADGRRSLRIAATCKPGVPGPADTPGVGDGATPELTPAARQDYFALRAGIAEVSSQLAACQDILRSR